MKKLVFATLILIAAIMVLLVFIKSYSSKKFKDEPIPSFSIVNLDGNHIEFKKENFPRQLILNFFGTECGLCAAEVSDLILFSRKHNVDILFVTPDSISAIKKFSNELKNQGVNDNKISFAQISLTDAKKTFGDLVVPQSMIFDKGLKIKRMKKGIVSYQFLKKSFE